jgi:hypothetical protein
MAGKSYRALATVLLLVAGYLLAVAAVRAWQAKPGTIVAHRTPVATGPATRPVPLLSDIDLPAYEFLLRETENPRPHRRRPAKTQPTTVTLELDPATAPATQADIVPYAFVPQQPVVPLNVARAALDYVGADPDAEQVWAYAINDPNLSPSDRSNLIQGLNETGFEDPQNVTPNDLPLIVRRLELIEALAPDAMDESNAAAFAEAYKDLSALYTHAASQVPADESGGPASPVDPSLLPPSLPFGGQ